MRASFRLLMTTGVASAALSFVLSADAVADAEPVPPQSDLEAVANGSPRPAACRVEDSFWRNSATRTSQACAALARGYSALGGEPKRARDFARVILEREPKNTDAMLLDARALVALGDFTTARGVFRDAGVTDGSELLDVAALHDFARTLTRSALAKESARAYRLLMPRVDSLTPRGGRRLAAVVEASMAVMRESEAGAAEAVAFLSQHIDRSRHRGGDAYATLTLALALDRSGNPSRAFQRVTDDQVVRETEEVPRPSWVPWLLPYEVAAIQATFWQYLDRGAAADAWRRYLQTAPADAPFRSLATSRASGVPAEAVE